MSGAPLITRVCFCSDNEGDSVCLMKSLRHPSLHLCWLCFMGSHRVTWLNTVGLLKTLNFDCCVSLKPVTVFWAWSCYLKNIQRTDIKEMLPSGCCSYLFNTTETFKAFPWNSTTAPACWPTVKTSLCSSRQTEAEADRLSKFLRFH